MRTRPSGHVTILVLILLLTGACQGGTENTLDESTSPPAKSAAITRSSPSDEPVSTRTPCRERVRTDPTYRPFIPDTERTGSSVILPVSFVDGSTAELVYPHKLKLAELGVQPAASIGIRTKRPGLLHGRFLLITKADPEEFQRGTSPVEIYRGASGPVEVWKAEDRNYELLLVFKFGSWNVIVGDGNVGNFMGADNRKLWAENLHGDVTDDGFLVLEPRAPLAFPKRRGAPQLLLSKCFKFVDVRLGRCKDLKTVDLAKNQRAVTVGGVTVHRSETRRSYSANWCTPSRQVSVYVDTRHERFADLAVRGLTIRSVRRNPDAVTQRG